MIGRRQAFAALCRIAGDQQGFFTSRQAIEAGYADNTHPYHVQAGNWERTWRGIYRLRHLPPPEDGDKMAWYLWSRGKDQRPLGVYSHETALSLFDLGGFNPAELHLSVPPGFRRNGPLPPGLVLHRASVPFEERMRVRGFFVCRPLRALLDVANTHPLLLPQLGGVLAEGRLRGLVTERELAAPETQALLRGLRKGAEA